MAQINLNPTADQTIEWTPSAVASHYTLIDEGMARPVTTDYVSAASAGLIETFTFPFSDNGEDILSLQMRVYAGGALPSSYNVKFYISDSTNVYYPATVNPSEGTYKEGNVTMTENPFTGAPWTWLDLTSGLYKFGFASTAGDGTATVYVATFALLITTGLLSKNMVREGLVNIR